MREMGLTPRMAGVLKFITEYVARHGAMPSRSQLADAMDCHKTHAARTLARLLERGALHVATPGGALSGFGGAGVSVFIPADLAARLARFCADQDERLSAVVFDAISLHLDAVASRSEVDSAPVASALADVDNGAAGLSDEDALALAVAAEALGDEA